LAFWQRCAPVKSGAPTPARQSCRFVGVELKASYYRQAARNLAMAMRGTADLFSAEPCAAAI